jgi:hypothetical protein
MHRPTRAPLAAAAAALLALAPTAGAQLTLIDFHDYASPTVREWPATIGAPVTEDGFEFYTFFGPIARNVLGTWGTDPSNPLNGERDRPSNVGTSTPLFGTLAGERIDMAETFGARFALRSMDVSHLYAQSELGTAANSQRRTIRLRFFNYRTFDDFFLGMPTGFQDFLIPPPGQDRPLLNTLMFGGGFFDTVAVTWYQTSVLADDPLFGLPFTPSGADRDMHQFTNVVVSAPIPEPTVVTLVGAGLLVLVGVGARRQRGGAPA